MVEDPSSLLVSPARISHSVAEEGDGDVLKDDQVVRLYEDEVRPVKVVVVSNPRDSHDNGYGWLLYSAMEVILNYLLFCNEI